MKTLTIFDARYNGKSVACVYASSYSQANMMLAGAKVLSNELEDVSIDLSGKKARLEYEEGLAGYFLCINTPKQLDSPALKKAVAALLDLGYTTSNIRLAMSFVTADPQPLADKFQVLKNRLAFARDQAARAAA